MMTTLLLAAGALIIGVLGLVHLIYTIWTDKFEPRNRELSSDLRKVSPVLTSETSMWDAWIGFNASHSLGALLFAAVYGYLALFEMSFLLSNVFLVVVSLLTLFSYLALARRYWFRIPFFGILTSTIFFLAGYGLAYFG